MNTITCFECGGTAEHNHHVVPKSKGGKRTVPLCVDCHNLAHESKMIKSALIKAGIEAKKARGEKWHNGRPKGSVIWTSQDEEIIKSMKAEGKRFKEIQAAFPQFSRSTLYSILASANDTWVI